MQRFFLCLALCGALGGTALAAAADYDDPGMHYTPPPGWEKIELAAPDAQQPAASDSDERPPAAVYVFHRGQIDQRTIVIDIQPFDGPLDSFERQHEGDLRKADGTFVDKPIKTALANGMPVVLLGVKAGTEAGHYTQRFEYLMIDGTRSIAVSYSGRQGDFDQKAAVDAFSSLYVVAYPRHNP